MLLALMLLGQASGSGLEFSVAPSGQYTLQVDGAAWYQASRPTICQAGAQLPLELASVGPANGTDSRFGPWTGTRVSYTVGPSSIDYVFKHFGPNLAVASAVFGSGLDTSHCGSNSDLSTRFPAFDTHAARAGELHTLSWRDGVIATTAAAKGLDKLAANGLDCGPVASTDPSTGQTLVWSTLTAHKIIPQQTINGSYAMGLAAAIPSIPKGYSYSVLFSLSNEAGATAGMYHWGRAIQLHHNTSRLPSVTLSDIGYYTDDGAYYYVWGGAKELHDPQLSAWIPPRPWPAEEGLVLVKEALHASGVPVAYMQLDDWWYQGPFFFGNVKSVQDWHASNSSGLFPHGLPAFADRLGLPLQLYTPFWSDKFSSPYNFSESTQFKGTKLVVPDDSYRFFADLFDLGLRMTNGRFNTYEIDFLDSNFKGCQACMDDVGAADRWYAGMADAAYERNITIQYCLPSATDMLASLAYPAVVQARASGDYARPEGNTQPWGNVVTLGGASLLLGATRMAPSKDTLWTKSPQPPTSSDRTTSGYRTQPHVALDAILATLSLGPVGISDGLNQTDVGLISQSFMSATDSTLLRPSRPLSTCDAVFTNKSEGVYHRGADPDIRSADDLGANAPDIRSTHAALGSAGPNSHYVLAWMTTTDVTLQPTDLYPKPPVGCRLAHRQHVLAPSEAQLSGCADGKPAVPSCVSILESGQPAVIPAVGGTIADFSLSVFYEPHANGAYFLGELNKFVHVSPQRFADVTVAGNKPCGLGVTVAGSEGQAITVVCVDPEGIAHLSEITIPAAGSIKTHL